MSDNFKDMTQDELRQGALDELRGTGPVPEETDPKALAAAKQRLADDELKLAYLLRTPSSEATAADNAELRRLIREGIQAGF